MRQVRVFLVGLAIFMLVLSSPASASSTVVADSAGDSATGSPSYVDIVQAKVTHQIGRGTLYFSMELAGAIPAIPPDSFLGYNWFIDSVPGFLEDYVVVVRWCTERTDPPCLASGPLPRWEAFVNDFINPVTYFSSFKINGATVKAFVDPALLGTPSEFRWRSVTRLRPSGPGQPPVDLAPNTGFASFGP